jgi:hypothetical protein
MIWRMNPMISFGRKNALNAPMLWVAACLTIDPLALMPIATCLKTQ